MGVFFSDDKIGEYCKTCARRTRHKLCSSCRGKGKPMGGTRCYMCQGSGYKCENGLTDRYHYIK